MYYCNDICICIYILLLCFLSFLYLLCLSLSLSLSTILIRCSSSTGGWCLKAITGPYLSLDFLLWLRASARTLSSSPSNNNRRGTLRIAIYIIISTKLSSFFFDCCMILLSLHGMRWNDSTQEFGLSSTVLCVGLCTGIGTLYVSFFESFLF